MPELSTADADEIKAWKLEKHLGSPTSILFFTQEQLGIWNKERIIFMADYSTGGRSLLILSCEGGSVQAEMWQEVDVVCAGKTTLLKSKAASLARAGESVTFIFLGGSGKTEAVMSIANKLDFAKYPNITVLSQQDLEKMYKEEHPWHPRVPSPLSLLKFYIGKERPQHVLVDEVPFEKSTWRQLITLQARFVSKLESNFGLAKGFMILFAIWFLSCLAPLLYLAVEIAIEGGILHRWMLWAMWWCSIEFSVLLYWFFVGMFVNTLSLDKTGSLLNSLQPLLPSTSSFLWLALHSSPLTDKTGGFAFGSGGVSEEKSWNWRRKLATTFTIPTFNHNLRNSHEVAGARGLASAVTISFQNKALATAPAPRPLPTLPPSPVFLPIHLPIHSTSQLGEAVNHAYITSLGSPDTLVVLLDDINQQDVVKTSLTNSGLSVVTYIQPKDSTGCKTFLVNPVGALITTSQLFSGMEAANVIWVRVRGKLTLQRSSILRAIHKLCIIDTEKSSVNRSETSNDFKVDRTFTKCYKTWFDQLLWCKSCQSQPVLLCRKCANECHRSCQREPAVFRTWLHLILQYNPCSCKATGGCKLKPQRRIPLWQRLGPSSLHQNSYYEVIV